MWKAEFNEHAGGFSHAQVAAGTAHGRHGHMGMFGDYLEREGHGKLLQWQHASSGAVKNIVVPVRDQRTIKVPDAEAPQEPKSPRARQSPRAQEPIFFFPTPRQSPST